jgi:hypothetical protein
VEIQRRKEGRGRAGRRLEMGGGGLVKVIESVFAIWGLGQRFLGWNEVLCLRFLDLKTLRTCTKLFAFTSHLLCVESRLSTSAESLKRFEQLG